MSKCPALLPAHCKCGCGVTSKLGTKRVCFVPHAGIHYLTVALDGVTLISKRFLEGLARWMRVIGVCVVWALQHVVNEWFCVATTLHQCAVHATKPLVDHMLQSPNNTHADDSHPASQSFQEARLLCPACGHPLPHGCA